MREVKITLALFFLVFHNVIAQHEADNKQAENWATFIGDGYQLNYPKDWELNESLPNAEMAVLSELTSEADSFRENVNLLIQDLTGTDIDLDQYVQISENQVRNELVNGRIFYSDRHNVTGSEFHMIIYSGQFGTTNLKLQQHYLIKDKKAYVITLTCAYTEFDNYQKIGAMILGSFQFK
ncbi:MAG: hypothetical protein RH948_08170 [Cyclobacteriaceae bacterium]